MPAKIQPPSGKFVIRMDPGLHAALRASAVAAGTSLNDYCVTRLALASSTGATADDGAAAVIRRAAAIGGGALMGVVAFGSWARGEATEESDADVMIVLDESVQITREMYRQWDAAPVSLEGRPVEPLFARIPAPDAQLPGLWAEIAMDGIVLFDRGYTTARRLAELRAQIAEGRMTRRWSNGQPYWVAA